jgi:hypothetical protein
MPDQQIPSSRPRRLHSPRRFILTGAAALLLAAPLVRGATDAPVSRKEYEQMKREMAAMRAELNALKAEKPAVEKQDTPRGAAASAIALLNKKVDDLASVAEMSKPGESKFHIAGSASATFSTSQNEPSNFAATFSPILLWHLNDHLLFEGEVEFELDGGDTVTKLEYAALDWSINDYVTLVAGKFLNPMNNFVERYEPKWINKLPDTPLGIYDGFLPESNVGFQLRGVVPVGSSKINMAAYVSNAPRLITDDPAELGHLNFDNFTSSADDKAVGGRVGFQLCPNFEIGYGIQYAKVQGDSGPSVRSLQQSIDVSTHLDAFKGRFSLLGQYAWSDVGSQTYDADGSLGVGPLSYTNKRQGGYAQLSYRGKQFESDLLNRLEFIVRADHIDALAGDPNSTDQKRLTLGLDYWVNSSVVVKSAYEFQNNRGEPNNDTFLIGIATGL